MKVYEFNKYAPRHFRRGTWREDWFSVGHIGTDRGGRLTREAYLETEQRYLEAVHLVMGAAGVAELYAHGVAFWSDSDALLERLKLDDVLRMFTEQPVEGEALSGERLDNAVRRCLREVGWLEFTRPKEFLLHVGYDYRLIIACSADLRGLRPELAARSLFSYESRAALRTLREWGVSC